VSAKQIALHFEPSAAGCLLCESTGWRQVVRDGRRYVTRCECRKASGEVKLVVIDHKSSAAGER
jgi:hypothetical protein